MANNRVPKAFNPGLNHTFYFLRTFLYKKVREHAPDLSGKLLDFGCGSKPYQSLFTNVTEYVGLDFASEGHSHEKESIDVFYDGKTIPFPDEYFDSVLSSEVFEHVFNLAEILPEINRVMKPGAKILITCPFVWPEHEVPVDFARYTVFALQHMLQKAGFTIVLTDKSGDFSSAIYQMRMVYFSEHVIPAVPLLGRSKFFRTSLAPGLYVCMNLWFSFWHKVLPKSKASYMNNIIIAQKK
ncbi:MAG: class I SAM-dependent methyltransferase [Chitinophagaceae bacterium]